MDEMTGKCKNDPRRRQHLLPTPQPSRLRSRYDQPSSRSTFALTLLPVADLTSSGAALEVWEDIPAAKSRLGEVIREVYSHVPADNDLLLMSCNGCIGASRHRGRTRIITVRKQSSLSWTRRRVSLRHDPRHKWHEDENASMYLLGVTVTRWEKFLLQLGEVCV